MKLYKPRLWLWSSSSLVLFLSSYAKQVSGLVPATGFSKSPLMPGKGKVCLPPWLFCQLFSECHYIPSQARPILNQHYPKKVQSARQGQGLPSPWLSNYVAHPCFYMKQFLWIDRKHRLKADDEAHGRKAQKVQISSERAEGPLVILEYSFLWAQRPFVSLFPPQPTNLARFGPKMGL